jgi:Tol biopolymer transport system component
MNPDGSGLGPVTRPDARVIHPSWSPDGTKIVYCTDDDLKPPKKNASDIEVIDVKTRKVNPVWSPDGKSIAFRRMLGEMNSEVFRRLAGVRGQHRRQSDRAQVDPRRKVPVLSSLPQGRLRHRLPDPRRSDQPTALRQSDGPGLV